MNVYLEHLDENGNKNKNICKICPKKFQIMVFLLNSIEDGWKIQKENSTFVFSKKHENKKKYMDEKFLASFVDSNLNFENILLH